MKNQSIPLVSWILLAIGLVFSGRCIADKADTIIGICGMVLCTLAVATRLRHSSKKKSS